MVNMVIKLFNKSKTETQQQTNRLVIETHIFNLRCEMNTANLNTKGKQYLPFIKVF